MRHCERSKAKFVLYFSLRSYHICTMALSVTTHPPLLIMAYQPVKFVIQSNSVLTPLRIAGGITQGDGDSIQADGDKKASFELSDYLQGLITARGFTDNTAQVYTNNPKAVTFNFVEWTGDPAADTFDLAEIGPYYLIDGYIPKSRRKALYATYTSLLAYLVASKSCLSWWPDAESKRVLPTQREFINFLNTGASTVTLKLDVTILFTDGTSSAASTAFTVAGVTPMQMVYFPAGYTELGLSLIMAQAYPDQTLQGWSVVVKTGSTVLSKVYSYTLDSNYYQNPRTLWIRNAFGLWEVLCCTGLSDQENTIKPEYALTDGQSLPDKLNWKTEETLTVVVNTGFLTSAQMQWLADMDFKEAYEMIGTVLHPIVFKDITLPVVHDGNFQYSAELEYEYAFNETIEIG